MATGFSPAQKGHVVNILPPVDVTGGKVAQAFSMRNYAHATIIVQIGVSAAAPTAIILKKCQDNAGTGAVAIPFNLYTQEVAGASQDVLSDRQSVAAAGYAPSANDGIFYVLEVDAAELDAANPYLQLNITNGVNSVIASAVAVLSGPRFASAVSPTVTA
jgi:hypothetical protein